MFFDILPELNHATRPAEIGSLAVVMTNWTAENLSNLPQKDDVRLRGLEMTRLETFCDAAFAIAVTLLVIAGGAIPGSYDELVAALKDVPAFLFSFAIIVTVWIAHRRWSRRYGLEDGWTTLISLAMVFVMLVYVYPLRMMASAFMSFLSGGLLPSNFTHDNRDLAGLFVIYGIGFAIQTSLLALLYLRALRARQTLRLNELERLRTEHEVFDNGLLAATGLISALVAIVLPTSLGGLAGFVYLSLPVTLPLSSLRHGRQIARVRDS